jgi:hypothetical protein
VAQQRLCKLSSLLLCLPVGHLNSVGPRQRQHLHPRGSGGSACSEYGK